MKIEKVHLNDYKNIAKLNKKNNLIILKKKDWKNIWLKNPYILKENKNWNKGWKIVDDKKNILGVILNIPFIFKYKGTKFIAAVCSNYVIDKKYRSHSLKLRYNFLNQKNVDFCLTNTANEKSEKIMEAFKANKISQYEYQERLIYILRKKKIIFNYYKKIYKLFSFKLLKNILFKRNLTKINDISYKIKKNFDEPNILENFLTLKNSLHSSKENSWLEWKYNIYLKEKKLLIIKVYKKEKFIGCLVLVENNLNQNNLKKITIVEIIGFNELPEYLNQGLYYCIKICKKKKFDLIDIIGFNKKKRKIIEKSGFVKKKSKNFNFLVKNNNKKLQNALFNDVSRLDLSITDGDGIFYL